MARVLRMGGRRWTWVVLGAVLGLGVASCAGEATKLDQRTSEREVGRALAADLPTPIVAVTCPDDLRTDRSFRCQVDLGEDHGTLEVDVRFDSDAGLEVSPRQAVLAGTTIAESLQAQLGEQLDRTFAVFCGDGVPMVREPGAVVACRAREDGARRSVDVTIEDAAGSLSFEILEP